MAAAPQTILSAAPESPIIAGLPAVLRTAHQLAGEADAAEILLCLSSEAFSKNWRPVLERLPCREIASYNGAKPLRAYLSGDRPAVVLAPEGIADLGAFKAFCERAFDNPAPTSWVWKKTAIAAYYPKARRLLDLVAPASRDFPHEALRPSGAIEIPAPEHAWIPADDAGGISRAETRLFESLRRDTDGYLARIDRTLSIALSRRLVRTTATPNQITTFSLAVGLLGAALLASAGYAASLAGALLLWSCCVLDGCDGEVARLKLQCSEAGARYDVVADNVVHLAIFAAIPLHIHRVRPELSLWKPAVMLMAGVLLSMLAVWRLILAQPENRRASLERVFERVASRDFIYLVALLTALKRLEWFLYSAAVGANLFWAGLCAVFFLRRRSCR